MRRILTECKPSSLATFKLLTTENPLRQNKRHKQVSDVHSIVQAGITSIIQFHISALNLQPNGKLTVDSSSVNSTKATFCFIHLFFFCWDMTGPSVSFCCVNLNSQPLMTIQLREPISCKKINQASHHS